MQCQLLKLDISLIMANVKQIVKKSPVAAKSINCHVQTYVDMVMHAKTTLDGPKNTEAADIVHFSK